MSTVIYRSLPEGRYAVVYAFTAGEAKGCPRQLAGYPIRQGVGEVRPGEAKRYTAGHKVVIVYHAPQEELARRGDLEASLANAIKRYNHPWNIIYWSRALQRWDPASICSGVQALMPSSKGMAVHALVRVAEPGGRSDTEEGGRDSSDDERSQSGGELGETSVGPNKPRVARSRSNSQTSSKRGRTPPPSPPPAPRAESSNHERADEPVPRDSSAAERAKRFCDLAKDGRPDARKRVSREVSDTPPSNASGSTEPAEEDPEVAKLVEKVLKELRGEAAGRKPKSAQPPTAVEEEGEAPPPAQPGQQVVTTVARGPSAWLFYGLFLVALLASLYGIKASMASPALTFADEVQVLRKYEGKVVPLSSSRVLEVVVHGVDEWLELHTNDEPPTLWEQAWSWLKEWWPRDNGKQVASYVTATSERWANEFAKAVQSGLPEVERLSQGYINQIKILAGYPDAAPEPSLRERYLPTWLVVSSLALIVLGLSMWEWLYTDFSVVAAKFGVGGSEVLSPEVVLEAEVPEEVHREAMSIAAKQLWLTTRTCASLRSAFNNCNALLSTRFKDLDPAVRIKASNDAVLSCIAPTKAEQLILSMVAANSRQLWRMFGFVKLGFVSFFSWFPRLGRRVPV